MGQAETDGGQRGVAGDVQTLALAAAAECRGLRSAGTFACLLFNNHVMGLRGGASRATPTRQRRNWRERPSGELFHAGMCCGWCHARLWAAAGQAFRQAHRVGVGVGVGGDVGLAAAGPRQQLGRAAGGGSAPRPSSRGSGAAAATRQG